MYLTGNKSLTLTNYIVTNIKDIPEPYKILGNLFI